MKRARGAGDGPARVSNGQAAVILGFVATGLLFFALGRLSPRAGDAAAGGGAASWAAVPRRPDTLVVYSYANRDWEYPRNLAFFVQHGIREGDGADYVVILQQSDHPLHAPAFPPYVRVLTKNGGECYGWGAFGWMLGSGLVDTRPYNFFVLVDSSVRGPFIAPYVPASIPWHRLLTRRIDRTVKLVGPVISCEGAPFKGEPASKWRDSPSVQSYAIAFDQAALRIIRGDPEITQCYWDRWDSTWHGELGATLAVLNAGFNIDSFIHRFQGVDWRKRASWGCNQRMSPTGEAWMDGLTLSPHELMFVKVKDHLVQSTNSLSRAAAKLSDWVDGLARGETDILTNSFVERPEEFKVPLVAMQKARSPQCFDHGFYRDANFLQGWTDEQLWHSFIHSGQFESRPHRWQCSWEVPPELLEELDRYHEQGHPHVKRQRGASAIEAAGAAKVQERAKLSSEIELQRLRSAIV